MDRSTVVTDSTVLAGRVTFRYMVEVGPQLCGAMQVSFGGVQDVTTGREGQLADETKNVNEPDV